MIWWYDIYAALQAHTFRFRSVFHSCSSLLFYLLLLFIVIFLANLVGWWYSFIGVLHIHMHTCIYWISVARSPHPFVCLLLSLQFASVCVHVYAFICRISHQKEYMHICIGKHINASLSLDTTLIRF